MSTSQSKLVATRPWLAAFLVLLGSLLASTKAIFVKLAYQHEVDSISLLALRMAFALPVFLVIAWFSGKKPVGRQPQGREWLAVFGIGLSGYYLASMTDFMGLQYISAGMERLILFLYPTLVLFMGLFWFRKPILKIQWLALLLTYAGIALAFVQGAKLDGSPDFWLGAILVFSSAVTYAIYVVGSGQFLPLIGTLRFTSYAMIVSCVCILVHHGIFYQWKLFHFSAPVYLYALAMAILATVIASLFVSEGIRIIGASNASIISSVGPISTIALAYIFLDESFGNLQWFGTFLVIGGVVLISLKKR